MDKLFIKCIEKSKNVDMTIVWQIIDYTKRFQYPELTINELFEMIFWDVMLCDYTLSIEQIKMVFVKYGDETLSMMKQYIKGSDKDYRLNAKEQSIFEEIKKEL
jgi:hypothetical protein